MHAFRNGLRRHHLLLTGNPVQRVLVYHGEPDLYPPKQYSQTIRKSRQKIENI